MKENTRKVDLFVLKTFWKSPMYDSHSLSSTELHVSEGLMKLTDEFSVYLSEERVSSTLKIFSDDMWTVWRCLMPTIFYLHPRIFFLS